ncbi:MAG: SWIM zinc finger family protein [Bacteroidetes bacterium]|nr:SWIM zinc finger family protein [Bacteroidota bacterium]
MVSQNEVQITRYAESASMLRQARSYAQVRKWLNLGKKDGLYWGELPFVEKMGVSCWFSNEFTTGFCTCREKFPCSHLLGLMLLQLHQLEAFQSCTEYPSWLERKELPAEKKEPIVKNRRQETRFLLEMDGKRALERWIKDLIRGGLLQLPEKSPAFFEDMARRMVDAKCPGWAGMVRNFQKINYFESGVWQTSALEICVQIWLSIQAFEHTEKLPDSVKDQIYGLSGRIVRKQDLFDNPDTLRISDNWLVLGMIQDEEEEGLFRYRSWLHGTKTGKNALVLEYSTRFNPYVPAWKAGDVCSGMLAFYPSNWPYRAVFQSFQSCVPALAVSAAGFSDWKTAQQDWATQIALHPWLHDWPQIMQDVCPFGHETQRGLCDKDGYSWPLDAQFPENDWWQLMALTGSKAHTISLLRNNESVYPLGVWIRERYLPLKR